MKKIRPKYITKTREQRLLNSPFPIMALTGGIATGKSTVTAFLQAMDIDVICADTIIKQIYQRQDTFQLLSQITPTVVKKNEINFKELRKIFFNDPNIKQQIETHLFNHYNNYLFQKFININQKQQNFILYDIPLLFEKKLHQSVDISICVYAPQAEQLKRIITRDHSSVKLAEQVIKNQLDIETKRKQADFIIYNTSTFDQLKKNTLELLNKLIINE